MCSPPIFTCLREAIPGYSGATAASCHPPWSSTGVHNVWSPSSESAPTVWTTADRGDAAGRLYEALVGRWADTSLDGMAHRYYRSAATSTRYTCRIANIWIGRGRCREASGPGEQDHYRRRRDRGCRSGCGLPTRQTVQKLLPTRHSDACATTTPSAANSDTDFAPNSDAEFAARSPTQEDGARQHCLQQPGEDAGR